MQHVIHTQETRSTFTHPFEVVQHKANSNTDELLSCAAITQMGPCGAKMMRNTDRPYILQCVRCKLEKIDQEYANQQLVAQSVLNKTAIFRRRLRWQNIREKHLTEFSRQCGGRVC